MSKPGEARRSAFGRRTEWPLQGLLLARLGDGAFTGWHIVRTDKMMKITRKDPRGVRKSKIFRTRRKRGPTIKPDCGKKCEWCKRRWCRSSHKNGSMHDCFSHL